MQAQPRLYQRGARGIWWASFGTIGGVPHRRSTMQRDRSRAEDTAAAMARELRRHADAERIKKLTLPLASPAWSAQCAEDHARLVLLKLWRNARGRARQSGLAWAFSFADFERLVAASDGRCAVTGLPFAMTIESRHPFKPSVDRIDNALGYSIGNCRLVLMAVNYAMNVWGEELFRTIALSYASATLQACVPKMAQVVFTSQKEKLSG